MVGQSVIRAQKPDLTWLVVVVSAHGGRRPDLRTVRRNHVEQSRVVDFTVLDYEGLLLALEAIVERVETADDVPRAGQELVVDLGHGVCGVSASSVVKRVRRWQAQASIVNVEAAHHVVHNGCRVAL